MNDFIDGYIQSFPDEADAIKKIFREDLGFEYSPDLPASIWIMVKDHPHRVLAMDPYGSFKLPFYTFNLNAAEVPDLLTMQGISEREANRIIRYRDSAGYFSGPEDLKQFSGLSSATVKKIITSSYDREYAETMTQKSDFDFTIGKLLKKPGLDLLSKASIYFILACFIAYIFLFRKETPGFKRKAILFSKYALLWILYIFAGLIAAVLSVSPWLQFAVTALVINAVLVLIYRKSKNKLVRNLVISTAMCGCIIISLI
jgi:hypothetical protein